MDDDDFKECWFIQTEMKFYTYRDFIKNCKGIKRLYDNNLSRNGKLFYKWYVYANIHLTSAQKNKVWDYINNYIEIQELYTCL